MNRYNALIHNAFLLMHDMLVLHIMGNIRG